MGMKINAHLPIPADLKAGLCIRQQEGEYDVFRVIS